MLWNEELYKRLEKALLEEPCSFAEAKCTVDRLEEVYFRRKPDNYLKTLNIQEIARTRD